MLEGLEPKKNKGVYCKIEQLMKTLDDTDQKILNKALGDKDKWSDKGLSTALRERKLSVADTTIAKHRRKICACFRK
jgi:DNA-directed RNA polymerase specialized sigma54-like protein